VDPTSEACGATCALVHPKIVCYTLGAHQVDEILLFAFLCKKCNVRTHSQMIQNS
jgi:hypothetical protein